MSNGLVTMANRIVIPAEMQKEVLDRLHESHQGITKCRENAQSTVWWPNISKDIKDVVENCLKCRENRPTQCAEPLQPTSLPSRPWERIAADLFELNKRHYLVVIDYYSRWIEIKVLPSTSSNAVIGRLKDIFSSHGIADELVSDNGPQFISEEFRQFAARYGFVHNTSSPHFHQANGEAERAIQTAKKNP